METETAKVSKLLLSTSTLHGSTRFCQPSSSTPLRQPLR